MVSSRVNDGLPQHPLRSLAPPERADGVAVVRPGGVLGHDLALGSAEHDVGGHGAAKASQGQEPLVPEECLQTAGHDGWMYYL